MYDSCGASTDGGVGDAADAVLAGLHAAVDRLAGADVAGLEDTQLLALPGRGRPGD